MPVDVGLVEQRLNAVHEVLDGATVTDVVERNGVTRRRCTRGCAGMRTQGSLV